MNGQKLEVTDEERHIEVSVTKNLKLARSSVADP
jgi:hypothetical protein